MCLLLDELSGVLAISIAPLLSLNTPLPGDPDTATKKTNTHRTYKASFTPSAIATFSASVVESITLIGTETLSLARWAQSLSTHVSRSYSNCTSSDLLSLKVKRKCTVAVEYLRVFLADFRCISLRSCYYFAIARTALEMSCLVWFAIHI